MEINEIEDGVFTYEEYYREFEKWVKNKESSSERMDPAYIGFTKLNWSRSQRIHHTLELWKPLIDLIKGLKNQYEWKVITESWCGDSAQSLPVIAELVKLNPEKISLTIYLRDKHPDLINQNLTLGNRSIPKFIVTDSVSRKQIFIWGPRPKPAQDILISWKAEQPQRSWEDFELDLHAWYFKDKTQTLQKELYHSFSQNSYFV